MKSIFFPLFLSAVFLNPFSTSLEATCAGKIDIGPAFVHIDVLESGHTVKRMDMWAVRADASYIFWKGLFVKPTVLYANGGAADGGVFTAGFGIGHYTPINSVIALSPQFGVTYSHLWTRIDLNFPEINLQLENLRERFKAWAPYVALEVCCKIGDGLRLSGSIQYAWSRSKTTISNLVKQKSNCKGPTYSVLLEKDLSDKWSVNIGGAYNLSLTKERHGLRGSGVKMGLAYWF